MVAETDSLHSAVKRQQPPPVVCWGSDTEPVTITAHPLHTTDGLVALAIEHDWTVTDTRDKGVLWFRRGLEYAYLGTTRAGERILSCYGGVSGRAASYWAGGGQFATRGVPVDYSDVLAQRLSAPRYQLT